jgi:hypothetical protein
MGTGAALPENAPGSPPAGTPTTPCARLAFPLQARPPHTRVCLSLACGHAYPVGTLRCIISHRSVSIFRYLTNGLNHCIIVPAVCQTSLSTHQHQPEKPAAMGPSGPLYDQ